MSLLFKPGVTLIPDPAGARLLGSIERLARRWPSDLTVSCGSDSHPPTDPHSLGRAFDVRTHGMTDDEKRLLIRAVLLDLQDGPADPPKLLAIQEIWYALATRAWFGQIEHYGDADEHCHLQLRKNVTFQGQTGQTVNA